MSLPLPDAVDRMEVMVVGALLGLFRLIWSTATLEAPGTWVEFDGEEAPKETLTVTLVAVEVAVTVGGTGVFVLVKVFVAVLVGGTGVLVRVDVDIGVIVLVDG